MLEDEKRTLALPEHIAVGPIKLDVRKDFT